MEMWVKGPVRHMAPPVQEVALRLLRCQGVNVPIEFEKQSAKRGGEIGKSIIDFSLQNALSAGDVPDDGVHERDSDVGALPASAPDHGLRNR